MKENFKKLDPYKQDHSSKFKTGANIFKRCFDKTKISDKETIRWEKNNKTFIHRKRNLWDENSNLRKDKEKLLDENDDLFYENNKLKYEKDDLLDKNDQLRYNVDEINEKLSRKKRKYEALKEKNKVLHGDNKKLRKENENLSEQNNYMRNLLSYFGIIFNKDGRQISNNTENQQMLNPFVFPLIIPDEPSLFDCLNKSTDNQKQKPMPKTSFSQLQK